jgi:polar amino acid transport system permease protein
VINLTGFFEFAWESLPALLRGTAITLTIWAICISIGTLLGILLSLGRVYGNKVIYRFSTIYVEIFRGTPMLAQMLIIYLGLPDIGIIFQPIVAASIAIGLNTAAYQAEYFRGAIQTIPAAQMTAARSIGMSKTKAICYIILPQALRLSIPQWSNEVILELKFTSIAFAIGVPELMAQAKIIGFRTFRYSEIFAIAAFIYLFLVTIFTRLLDIFEKRVRIPGLK